MVSYISYYDITKVIVSFSESSSHYVPESSYSERQPERASRY